MKAEKKREEKSYKLTERYLYACAGPTYLVTTIPQHGSYRDTRDNFLNGTLDGLRYATFGIGHIQDLALSLESTAS